MLFASDTMPVRFIALSLVKRFCDRNFTDAFAAFVACILEPSSLPIPVLTATMQIMQSSFCSKTADDSVYSLFIYAFYFFLLSSNKQTKNKQKRYLCLCILMNAE